MKLPICMFMIDVPKARMAFCATSWSLSCERRLSISITPTVGLLMDSSATASGTALLQACCAVKTKRL